jgi:hypothetical protein
MRYALALALIATCAAQPALAKPCTYPMTRLASAQADARRPAPATPRAKEEERRPPCTILQKWTPGETDQVQALT